MYSSLSLAWYLATATVSTILNVNVTLIEDVRELLVDGKPAVIGWRGNVRGTLVGFLRAHRVFKDKGQPPVR